MLFAKWTKEGRKSGVNAQEKSALMVVVVCDNNDVEVLM